MMIDANAFALRPVRVLPNGELRQYTGITFPVDAYAGCEAMVRRLKAWGHIAEDNGGICLDVLDADGDILQDFPLTKAGLKYLQQNLSPGSRVKVAEPAGS